MFGISSKSFVLGALYGVFGMLLIPLLLYQTNIIFDNLLFTNLPTQMFGIALFIAGFLVLLTSVIEYLKVQESPLPTDKPTKLVVLGIYKHTRNPMFLGSSLIWFGEAFLTGSLFILIFAFTATLANHIHLIVKDEPMLGKRFGKEYKNYCKNTPRYIPRLF